MLRMVYVITCFARNLLPHQQLHLRCKRDTSTHAAARRVNRTRGPRCADRSASDSLSRGVLSEAGGRAARGDGMLSGAGAERHKGDGPEVGQRCFLDEPKTSGCSSSTASPPGRPSRAPVPGCKERRCLTDSREGKAVSHRQPRRKGGVLQTAAKERRCLTTAAKGIVKTHKAKGSVLHRPARRPPVA